MAKKYVTIYEVTKHYGGAEEGGWYYPVTSLVRSDRVKTVQKGRKQIEKLHEQFSEEYDGIDYCYAVIETKRNIGREDDTDKPTPRYC